MHIPFRLPLLAALVAASLATGCNKEKAPATAPTAAPAAGGAQQPSPDTVVATYGDGKKVTLGEIDKEIQPQLKQLEDEMEKQKFQLRRQAIENHVLEQLLAAEAKKRGMAGPEELLKAEVESKVKPPSEEEVKKTFEESKGQLPPGSTLEQFRPQIEQFLTRQQQQQAARTYVEQLRKDANVQVTFKEPRKQVEAKGPSRGPEDAKVTIVEFSDFECPFCGRGRTVVDQVMEAYPGQVRVVFRHFPLSFHPNAQKAAEASLCAHEQGKFWQYHDKLFDNQKALGVEQLKGHAKDLGLDTAKFNECLDSGRFAQQVKEDMEAGQQAGVSGTPAFFINGVPLSGAVPLEEFKAIIDEELKG